MRFGINTFVLTSPFATDQIQWIRTVKEWGFDCIEIAAEDPNLIDAPAIAKELKRNGLACSAVCGAFSGKRDLRGDPSEQQTALDYLEQLLDFANLWDAPQVVGPAYSRTGRAERYPLSERQKHWDRVVNNLGRASASAAQRKLCLAIEPLNRFETDFLNTCDQALELISAVGSPNLKILLDTFHMNIEETDPAEAIRQAGPLLGHIHISSSHRGIPGHDRMEWNRIAQALVESGYQDDLVLESFTPDNESLLRACSIWRPLFSSSDQFASEGIAFLQRTFTPI